MSRARAIPALAILLSLALASLPPALDAAEPTPQAILRFVDISPPRPADIMNDETPHLAVLGDDLVACWESDYTHWPGPNGEPPVEDSLNEDAQVRILHNGTWGPFINVSTDGLPKDGYAHHTRMTVHDGRLYVFWNSHSLSPDDTYSVVMRVYDPATGTWGPATRIVDTPPNGLDAGGSGASHDGKLWVVWQSVRRLANNTTVPGGIEIKARWFDGSTWGPEMEVSQGEEGPDTEASVLSVGGVLHVAWMHDSPVRPGNADVHWSRLLPNGTFSPPTTGLGFGDDRNDKKPSLAEWGDRAVLLWQSDGIDQRGRLYGDIVLRTFDGSAWGTAVQVTPVGRYAGNTNPAAAEMGGRLYIAWASNDDAYAVGSDVDVVMRDYDGERLGGIVLVSPVDTTIDNRAPDDGSVDLAVYQGRLYAAWDAIYSTVADGLEKDILLRYVGYDLDADGHDDQQDAFPDNASEWEDTDGDGHGDNSDAYPNDRTRWEDYPGDGEEDGTASTLVVVALGVAAAVIVVLAIYVPKRGPKGGNPPSPPQGEGGGGGGLEGEPGPKA